MQHSIYPFTIFRLPTFYVYSETNIFTFTPSNKYKKFLWILVYFYMYILGEYIGIVLIDRAPRSDDFRNTKWRTPNHICEISVYSFVIRITFDIVDWVWHYTHTFLEYQDKTRIVIYQTLIMISPNYWQLKMIEAIKSYTIPVLTCSFRLINTEKNGYKKLGLQYLPVIDYCTHLIQRKLV